MQFQDTTALVTGANRGIGHALVEGLLVRGVRRVYAAARDPKQLREIGARDARIVPLALDITQDDQVQAAVAAAPDVNLLINNAGVANFGSVLDGDFAGIEYDMTTNYFGTLRVIRAFTPVLQQNGNAALVNLLTIVSLASMAMLGSYCASKAAAYSLTQALRAELAPRGIRVHGVFPGPVDTDMIRAVEMPKTSALDVAQAILDGVEAGTDDDIRPDAMSQEAYATWLANPKTLERQFAAM